MRSTEQGMALVAVTMTLVLVLAVSAALVLATSSEASISLNFRGSQQALYAAEAAAEWALADLPAVAADLPTLSTVLATAATSGFVDGVAGGSRVLGDGSLLDVDEAVERNAAWTPFAYGALRDLLPLPAAGLEASPFYVMVFVADDPLSAEGLLVMAEAFGPRGAHKTLELRVLRDAAGVHLMSWAERR